MILLNTEVINGKKSFENTAIFKQKYYMKLEFFSWNLLPNHIAFHYNVNIHLI